MPTLADTLEQLSLANSALGVLGRARHAVIMHFKQISTSLPLRLNLAWS